MRKAKITTAILAIVLLFGGTALAWNSGVAENGKLDVNGPKLQSTEQKLNSLNVQYEKLNTQLNKQGSSDKQTIQQLKSQQDQLQKEKQDLESKLQAKAAEKQRLADAAAKAADTLTATGTANAAAAPVVIAALPSGSHTDWMAQAGIAASDYGFADYIINHEGSYRPCVRYGGLVDCNGWQYGTAYGVCQALPGNKMASAGADWATNPITQLRWCNSYAQSRYGGWANAYNYWLNHKVW